MHRQEAPKVLVPEVGVGSQLALRLGVDDTPPRNTMIAASSSIFGHRCANNWFSGIGRYTKQFAPAPRSAFRVLTLDGTPVRCKPMV
jgi:hypothetical protein